MLVVATVQLRLTAKNLSSMLPGGGPAAEDGGGAGSAGRTHKFTPPTRSTTNFGKIGDFYSGYAKVACNSCSEASKLENPNSPLVFVAGVQKSGTTELVNRMLGNHPDVFFRGYNELHTFDYRWTEDFGGLHDVDRCNVMRHYNTVLSGAPKEGDAILDKSPSYIMKSEIIPQRILCAFPNAKIVILLRNPVDRCYSHYHAMLRWAKKKGRAVHPENASFEKHLMNSIRYVASAGLLQTNLTAEQEYNLWSRRKPPHRNCIGRGLYAVQIRQWMAVLGDHFGWDKIWDHLLILDSEEAWKDEQRHFDTVLDFLGLSPFQLPPRVPVQNKYNSSMDSRTRQRLENLFRPHNEKLDELLSPHGIHISWAK